MEIKGEKMDWWIWVLFGFWPWFFVNIFFKDESYSSFGEEKGFWEENVFRTSDEDDIF